LLMLILISTLAKHESFHVLQMGDLILVYTLF